MKKHILIVSQYFYPEPFRVNDIALELYKRGYKVTVLTGIPNYPEGKFYKGYSWFKNRKEVWEGINIIRLPIISRGKSKFRLALNYYSFPFVGRIWARITKINPDIVFNFGLSPIMQALVGCRLSKIKRIPNYLYIQDLWPESLEVMAGIHNKHIINHYSKICQKIYNNCNKIFCTSNSFIDVLKERVDDPTKLIYLPQYPESFYKPLTKRSNKLKNNNLKIIFTGNIGEAQNLDILIEVAKRVDDVTFIIVGDGRYKKEFVSKIKNVADKFVIMNRVPAIKVPEVLSLADIGFISFKNNNLFDKTIPSKLQSYMACGVPILGSVDGETKKIIEDSKCGLCSSSNDINGLIKNIEVFKHCDLTLYKNNALNYVEKHFNKSNLIQKLISELKI